MPSPSVSTPHSDLFARFVKLFDEDAAKRIPLAYYVDKPWKVIRNDSLDRFGTPLEKRFSRAEIQQMLVAAGMADIHFSEHEPYLARRRPEA